MKLLWNYYRKQKHVTRIDCLTTIYMVLWKQIFSVVFLTICGAV